MGQSSSVGRLNDGQKAVLSEFESLKKCGLKMLYKPNYPLLYIACGFANCVSTLGEFVLHSLIEEFGGIVQVLPSVSLIPNSEKDISQQQFQTARKVATNNTRIVVATTCSRYLAFPVLTMKHANFLIIDTTTSEVVYVESHGNRSTDTIQLIESDVKPFLQDIGIREPVIQFLVHDNPQQTDLFCQMWAPLLTRWVLTIALRRHCSLFTAAQMLRDLQTDVLGNINNRRIVMRTLIPIAVYTIMGSLIAQQSKADTIGEAIEWARVH